MKRPGAMLKLSVDIKLLICTIILCLFGLIIVYDASALQGFQNFSDKYYYIRQQLLWMVLGFGSLTFFGRFPYHYLKKIALPFFITTFLLLILVNVPGLGVAGGGAHRWLKISIVTIQPTELIKLSAIIFFAAIFEKKKATLAFLLVLTIVSLIIGVLQKDLGSAIVFIVSLVGLYIVSGAPIRYFLALLPVLATTMAVFIISSSYRRQRVLAFLDPFADPQGYTYHISQILIALGSGGLFGLGFGQSRQKFAYIPEVTTDSIFSIIGEELGFFGALVLMSLFCFFILRGFKIAEKAPDHFARLLASGITLWLGTQAVVNLSAMVSLIPLTGVPLPFISYGGSALFANLVGVGILLNISKHTKL